MDTQTLAQSLSTVNGWKRINKRFLLVFGGGAKSSSIWDSTEVKDVFENELLRTDEHDDFQYYIYAFSTKGPLEAPLLDELKTACAGLELGTIRFDSQSYTALEPLRGFYPKDEDYTIVHLSRPDEGLLVYVVSDDKKNYPATAYALADGKHHIFPIESKFTG